MNENNVATNVQAQGQEQAQPMKRMGIHEMLWIIQTQIEVKKTKPQNAKFEYFDLGDILTAFKKVQKNVPCTLTMADVWVRDDTGDEFVIGKARLTSVFDPNEYIEAEGIIKPGYLANLGGMEQRCGGSNTYARKQAVYNLLGITEEQLDPDALTSQSPTGNRGQRQTTKNTTLQSAQQQGAKAQTVAQPKTTPAPTQQAQPQTSTPAKAQTQPQAPVQPQASASAQDPSKTGIVFTYPGDKLTMNVSTLSKPLTFPAFKEPADGQKAIGATFQMADPRLSCFNGMKIQPVLKQIFDTFDVEKLHLLSNYIKDQATSEEPIKLAEEDVMTLKNISVLMTAKLSRKAEQVQVI